MNGRKLPLIDRVEVYIVEENQPRWLAFLNSEHDLVDEIPYDMANLIVPNGKLAPNLVKRGIQMDRDYRASVDMALVQYGASVGRRLHRRQSRFRRAIGARVRDAERDPPRAQESVDSISVARYRR